MRARHHQVFCLALLGVALLAPAVAAESDVTWQDEVAWDRVLELAQRLPERRIVLYFTAEWCAPCRLLEKEVFTDEGADSLLKPLLRIRLHVDQSVGAEVARTHDVTSVPSFVLCEADGREIDRLRGYRNRNHFITTVTHFLAGEGTVGDLRNRLADDPDDARLAIALGLRHAERLELGLAATALRSGLERAVDLDAETAAVAWRALADVEERRNRPEAAVEALETLRSEWPEHLYPALTLRQLAVYRLRAGDGEGSVRTLQELVAMRPEDPEALDAFAWAAAQEGVLLEEAELRAREAVKLTERDPGAMSTLAVVLARREQFAEAMLWIKRAERKAPDDPRWARRREAIHRTAVLGD